MAHWAEIDENNTVLRVVVTSNDAPDEGEAWVHARLGGTWKQTSYNGNFRKHFAGIGFVFDEARDAFIPGQPYPSWVLDEDTCLWEAPIAKPTDGAEYVWDEGAGNWVEVPGA